MDRSDLEFNTYKSLKQYFDSELERQTGQKKRECAVPPELLYSILNLLVAPVVTALIAEYLIRKYLPEKEKKTEEERLKAEKLSENARVLIYKRAKKLGVDKQKTEMMLHYVSTKIELEIKIESEEEIEKILEALDIYLK